MLLSDPPPSQGDLRFSLFHIPVRIHPMFWVMGFILGASGGGQDVKPILIWVIAVFVSVLVHEMGHALAIRALGVQPWITLYGMGGLTNHEGGRFRPTTQILVSLAGPCAGFALAALLIVLLKVSGHPTEIVVGWPYVVAWDLGGFANPSLEHLCYDLMFVNVWWGILNLLPILPLDGGRIMNEALNICYPRRALQIALVVSLGVAAAMAVSGLIARPPRLFQVLLFGSLAYSSLQMLLIFNRGYRE